MRALVLGAGGSARAAAWALREAGAARSRSGTAPQSARAALAGDSACAPCAAPEPADLLVNCTAVGLERDHGGIERSATEDCALNQLGLTFDQLGEYAYVVDLVYRSTPTPLLAAAGSHGARTVDGLEILVAQGALSFELWTGARAAAGGHARRCPRREREPPRRSPNGGSR